MKPIYTVQQVASMPMDKTAHCDVCSKKPIVCLSIFGYLCYDCDTQVDTWVGQQDFDNYII